jgi:MFS superfamily sulfate permease-like transporter
VLVQRESGWQPQPVATAAEAAPGLVVYRFTHSLYYANAQQLTDEVSFLADRAVPPMRWLCLDVSAVDDIDYSAAEVVRSVYARLRARGVRLVVTGVMGDVQEASRYRFTQLFGRDAFYDRLDDVLKAYREQSRAVAPER